MEEKGLKSEEGAEGKEEKSIGTHGSKEIEDTRRSRRNGGAGASSEKICVFKKIPSCLKCLTTRRKPWEANRKNSIMKEQKNWRN